MKNRNRVNYENLRKRNIKSGIFFVLNIFALIVITGFAMPPKGYEKVVIMNSKGNLHYNKDINTAIPTDIVLYMTKNGFLNPMIPTEIYLIVENNSYKLRFVKDEDVLNEKRVLFSFNALELKLNSALNLDKKIIIEFTNNDLTKIFALPRGKDIINENAVEIFQLKTYEIDNFHTIQYNKTMPFSEVKKIGDAVKRLKNDFSDKHKINMVFLNNGSDYTFKFFILKQYWNNPSDVARSRRIIKYFKDSGISKQINLMFVDFMTYEQIKI